MDIKEDRSDEDRNIDDGVVEDFGEEWHRFDQSPLTESERKLHFDAYFSVFPWDSITTDSVGFDAGCGSGRWALLMASRVKHLHCIEPSSAINVARKNLAHLTNCSFYASAISNMSIPDNSMDFGYSLGVLHHIPDTQKGFVDCVKKLKAGAPFLAYVYYAFDNQPRWFRWLWRISDLLRRFISKLPYRLRVMICELIAIFIYYPLSRVALLMETAGISVHSFPLSVYRHRSLYSMKTDALDRFGTRLEQRFTRAEIKNMMEAAGLEKIEFSSGPPYYCVVGIKT